MKHKHLSIYFILALLEALLNPISARAQRASQLQTNNAATITFADLGENDIAVKAIYEQVFVDFPFAEGQQVDRAVLKLHMQHSPDLLPNLSDIVIALNDEPAANIILTPENAADGTTEIELPVEALKPGANELLFRFSMRLVENGCKDVNDANLWATIFSDSSISFESQGVPETTDLYQFPLPFSTFAALPASPQISIILPPAPTSAELSVAAQIAASLGQAAGWKKPPITVFLSDQMDENRLASDALIAITTGSRNTLTGSYSRGVTMVTSPYNPNQLMLVISGRDDQELARSAAMLTTRSARPSLTGSHIDPVDVTPRPMPNKPPQITFADLGLATKRVRGIGLHDLYYPIDIPYDWKTTSEASVEIRFSHGSAMTSASLMTTFINGFETANVRLDRRNDDDGRLVIQLSPRQIHPGRNWLHIVVDLHMPREDCKYRYFEEAWAEVSAEHSLMNLAHVVSVAPLDIHYMPAHLIVPNDLSADLFVLPASPSNVDLTVMARIAAKLGTYSDADAIRIQATTADLFQPQAQPVNVVAIGAPETNALINTYDAQLPQPLALDNNQITPTAGRALLPEEQAGQAAYLEVLTSPWSRFDSLVVVGARSSELLLRTADVIPTGGRRMKEQGSMVVITPSQIVDLTADKSTTTSDAPVTSSTKLNTAAILIGAFVMIMLLGIFIVVYRRRRAHEQENNE